LEARVQRIAKKQVIHHSEWHSDPLQLVGERIHQVLVVVLSFIMHIIHSELFNETLAVDFALVFGELLLENIGLSDAEVSDGIAIDDF
jgi:hypothetical protein